MEMMQRSLVRNAFLIVIGAAVCVASGIAFAADAPAQSKIELAQGWKLKSTNDEKQTGAAISQADFQDVDWHAIHRMPATVLEILQEDGVYPDLYVGKNMAESVPQELYKQDWWYRTTFDAPAGHDVYLLEFPGINYRAEIWLNGHLLSDSQHIVGMYVAHEINVTRWILKGQRNVLAVKVTPEQLVQDVDGVELADSWFDWINWKYLGFQGKYTKEHQFDASFVPDRNAGIWKPVYLKTTGEVAIENPVVNSELSLPKAVARLTVYANLHNFAAQPLRGTLKGAISRPGKPTIELEQSVSLSPHEIREVALTTEKYPSLVVSNPDL